jgi:breast cancer 2 susceptibility protein
MTADAAAEFAFPLGAGPQHFRNMLVAAGASPLLATEGWVANHFRWVVWKLACYERAFPAAMPPTLTPDRVMAQLRYRYEREVNCPLGFKDAIESLLNVKEPAVET